MQINHDKRPQDQLCQDVKVLGSFFLGVATCKFSDLGLLPAEGWAKKMPKRWGMRGGWGVYGVPFFTIFLVYQMSSGRSSHLCQHTIYGNTLAEVHEGIGNCPATEPCPFGCADAGWLGLLVVRVRRKRWS